MALKKVSKKSLGVREDFPDDFYRIDGYIIQISKPINGFGGYASTIYSKDKKRLWHIQGKNINTKEEILKRTRKAIKRKPWKF